MDHRKKRVNPTRSERNKIGDRQDWKCYGCGARISPTIGEYHHKDGDPSNYKLSNIVLVCANCHKIETNKQRIRKVQKRRKEKESRESDPLGLGAPKKVNLFGPSRRQKEPSLFGGGDIFGTPKKKGRKKKGLFDNL